MAGGADMRGGLDGQGHVLRGWGGGPMVIDSEDAGATVIAVVARRLLISPCPGIAMGVRTMVVVTVQGAPSASFLTFTFPDNPVFHYQSFAPPSLSGHPALSSFVVSSIAGALQAPRTWGNHT